MNYHRLQITAKEEIYQSRDRRDGNTWSSTVIQTILAGCAKRKREKEISDDAFVMTMSRKLHPTARATRECGCRPASPTRRNEVHGVVDDDRRCRRSGKPRMRHIGRSVTMPSAYERLARTALYQRCPGSENRITSAGWTSRLFEIIPRGPGTGTSIGGKWREIVSDLYSGRMDLSGKVRNVNKYEIWRCLDEDVCFIAEFII